MKTLGDGGSAHDVNELTSREENHRSLQLLHQHLLPLPALPRSFAVLLEAHLPSLDGDVLLGTLGGLGLSIVVVVIAVVMGIRKFGDCRGFQVEVAGIQRLEVDCGCVDEVHDVDSWSLRSLWLW